MPGKKDPKSPKPTPRSVSGNGEKEYESDFPHIGHKKILLSARRVKQKESGEERILFSVREVID